MEIATAVRRYKSEHGLSLGADLASLSLAVRDATLGVQCRAAIDDIVSITRAQRVDVGESVDDTIDVILVEGPVNVALRTG